MRHSGLNKADMHFDFDTYNNMRNSNQKLKPLNSNHTSGPSFSLYAYQLDFEIAEFLLDA
jgi:hypothetical protein